MKKALFVSFAVCALTACGGGSESEQSGSQVLGSVVADAYLFDDKALARVNSRRGTNYSAENGEQGESELATWHVCGDTYNSLIAENLYNQDYDQDGVADTNLTDEKGNLYYNIDLNGDKLAELNTLTSREGIYLNVDMNCDAAADVNIDNNFDGISDLNIDVDGDMVADRLIDIDGDGKPDFSYTDSDGVSLAGVKVLLQGKYGEFETTTDDNGKFSFERIPTGSYTLKADDVALDGSNIWTRTIVEIEEFDDSIGAFRMHQDPIITQVNVNNEQTLTGLWQDFTWYSSDIETEYAIGDTVSVEVIVEDPNQRPITAKFSADLELGTEEIIAADGVFKYQHQITEKDAEEYMVSIMAELSNDDGFFGLNGMTDVQLGAQFMMADYVETEELEVESVTVGDEVFDNPPDSTYMLVEVQQPIAIDGSVQIDIEVTGPDERIANFYVIGIKDSFAPVPKGDSFLFEADTAYPQYIYEIQYGTYLDYLDEREEVVIKIPLDTKLKPAIVNNLLINGVVATDVMARVGHTYQLQGLYSDPQNDVVECRFEKAGNHSALDSVISDWGACEVDYTFKAEDAVDQFNITVFVRNSDDIVVWQDYDDAKWYDVSVTK
ncbi:carboxypeptidase-like regulatory domain-containing protein [Shewanella fidelis]|uniref:Carboxypeptidase-like regulatory domain-containing protein n=1 Tax=Shewanella fidelis TaxID=173509 RepID=A0AAW8NK14_9GAMM|nr:carboxypeptidase-like regulatory domain-containing protein [Shewanella fidelis]MDR8522536.1 carboxypeptidase-like regulatory domain-containing protein [Shewanella fidelis]MDW4812930.1 carboxypeptidase-like regulatory domain-containing protein [Shewanella fidelis]MDW4816811.1 carboxypeptidase-like regulatory domain-containing protein [Shewanella fidelis]MDW4820937.1 carboxypeptidase-like regulatory domain-containing protein [Shewanella fidelis]MDW4825528.1 carboxypeptidase-like regulatory do